MAVRLLSLKISLLLFSRFVFGQELTCEDNDQPGRWYLPDRYIAVYAGGWGMFSAGVVFQPVKNADLIFNFGYTPPAYGEIYSVNAIATYNVLPVKFTESITFNPISFGGFINTNYSKEVKLNWSSKYPDDYYWWQSSLRYGPIWLMSLNYQPLKSRTDYGVFFQCSTNDLYISSYYGNTNALQLSDILVLGFGVSIGWK